MNHSFQSSQLNGNVCNVCKRPELEHTDNAQCECCPNVGPCELYIDILMCKECYEKEMKLQTESRANTEQRVLEQAFLIDQSIKIQTDLFNAKTVAIQKLKEAIDNDPSITEKHFALAKVLSERYSHLCEVIFGKRAELTEMENEQRAIQTYYNELAKKLKADEREKIKLKDVTYKPIDPATIKKPRPIAVKQYDKTAIREAAFKSGLQEQMIQMVCIARKVTPEEAVKLIQATMSKK